MAQETIRMQKIAARLRERFGDLAVKAEPLTDEELIRFVKVLYPDTFKIAALRVDVDELIKAMKDSSLSPANKVGGLT